MVIGGLDSACVPKKCKSGECPDFGSLMSGLLLGTCNKETKKCEYNGSLMIS
jgi:hypothetical protein